MEVTQTSYVLLRKTSFQGRLFKFERFSQVHSQKKKKEFPWNPHCLYTQHEIIHHPNKFASNTLSLRKSHAWRIYEKGQSQLKQFEKGICDLWRQNFLAWYHNGLSQENEISQYSWSSQRRNQIHAWSTNLGCKSDWRPQINWTRKYSKIFKAEELSCCRLCMFWSSFKDLRFPLLRWSLFGLPVQ